MVKNKRDLALALTNHGEIKINKISKKLNKIVEMWITSGSIRINNNTLIGNF